MMSWGGIDLVQEMMEEARTRPGARLCWSGIGSRESMGQAVVRSVFLGFDDEAARFHVRVALSPAIVNGEVVIRAHRFVGTNSSLVQRQSEAWAALEGRPQEQAS